MSSASQDAPLELQLPCDGFLQSLGYVDTRLLAQCTYSLKLTSRALRHVSGLLSILALPLVENQFTSNATTAFQETIPWWIDAALRMHGTQGRYRHLSHSCSQLLRNTIQIINNMRLLMTSDVLVRDTTCILLVHLCWDVLAQRGTASGHDKKTGSDDQLLCIGIVKISEACLSSTTVSRLATSQIISLLETPIGYGRIASTESDLWVSEM